MIVDRRTQSRRRGTQKLAVFEEAQQLLSRRRIRDIVFDEFAPCPAPTHRKLEQFLGRRTTVRPTISQRSLLSALSSDSAPADGGVSRGRRKLLLRGRR